MVKNSARAAMEYLRRGGFRVCFWAATSSSWDSRGGPAGGTTIAGLTICDHLSPRRCAAKYAKAQSVHHDPTATPASALPSAPGRAGRRAAALALLGECARRIRPAPLAALPRLAVN